MFSEVLLWRDYKNGSTLVVKGDFGDFKLCNDTHLLANFFLGEYTFSVLVSVGFLSMTHEGTARLARAVSYFYLDTFKYIKIGFRTVGELTRKR